MSPIYLHPEDFEPRCARCGLPSFAHDTIIITGEEVCPEDETI